MRPSFADKPVSGRETLFRGAIAIAGNGVPIFNPIKQDGRTDTYLAGELDEYGGHAGPGPTTTTITSRPCTSKSGLGQVCLWHGHWDGFPIMGYREPDGSEAQGLDWLNGHIHADTAYHYHATRDYPRLNGGFRGEVELRDGQVAVQPRARGVRPFTRPLRGATVTGFERHGEASYRLEFQWRGEDHSVDYTLQPGGWGEVCIHGRVGNAPSGRLPCAAVRPGRRQPPAATGGVAVMTELSASGGRAPVSH